MTIHDAAGAILWTDQGEVLVGQRAHSLRFMGGFVSFPGGRCDPGDEALAHRLFQKPGPLARWKAAAVRELFEETGMVIENSRPRQVPGDLIHEPFEKIVHQLGLVLQDEDFVEAGRWVTPEHSAIRFDARFFLVRVHSVPRALFRSSSPQLDPSTSSELVNLGFDGVSNLLEAHERFEIILSPVTRRQLFALRDALQDHAPKLIEVSEEHRNSTAWDVVPNIIQLPLLTPTLPPARHTNTYFVGGDRFLIIDPATYEGSEREKIAYLVEKLRPARPLAVVLTHHHADHVGSAVWCAKTFGLPIWAHRATRSLLHPLPIEVDATIEEGEQIDLGQDHLGRRMIIEALHTPGHAPGHLVFRDLRLGARAVIAGDMVAGIGTIIIDPDDGNMREYLQQLARLAALPSPVLLPAHGQPIIDGRRKLAEYQQHRLQREQRILEALEQQPGAEVSDLLPMAYADTDSALYPLAARSCLAHLEKLVEEGRASRRDEQFFVTHSPPNRTR